MRRKKKQPSEPAVPTQPYDVTTKELVEKYPENWLEFLGFPPAPVTVTEAGISVLSFAADKVLRVDDPNQPFILHIEFQSGYDPRLDRRELRYNVLLEERHEIPVVSIAVLLRPKADGTEVTGRVQRVSGGGRTRLDFEYTLVRLWEIPPDILLDAGLALLPLAPVAQVTEQELPVLILKMKRLLATETNKAEVDRLWLATYLLMGLRFSETLIDALLEGVGNMKESVTYQKILREGRAEGIALGKEEGIALGKQEGIALGKAEGREEGRINELKSIIERLGTKRFGTPDGTKLARISGMTDIPALEALVERILEVESWSELLALSE